MRLAGGRRYPDLCGTKSLHLRLRMNYSIRTLCLLLLLLALGGVSAQQFDLDQAIALTLENNPAVREGQANITAADAAVERSKSGYYPQVAANGSYSHIAPTGYVEFPSAEGLRRSSFVAPNNYNANLSFSYTIFDFGRTHTGVELAKVGQSIAESSLVLTRQELALATIQTFYRVHYLEEAIRVQDRQLEALDQTLQQTEELRANGEATGYEVLSTQVRISTAETTKAGLQNQRAVALIDLERLTGRNDLEQASLVNNWVDTTGAGPQVQANPERRAELAIARLQEESASLQETLAQQGFKPVLSATVAAGYKNQILPDIQQLRANYIAAAQVSVPLFTGYRNRYGVEEARARREAASFDRQNTEEQINAEVAQAVTTLNTSYENIARARLQVQQATEAAKLARLKYTNGIITNLDLLDSEIAVSQAEIAQLNTVFEYTLNTYQLKRALGLPLYQSAN